MPKYTSKQVNIATIPSHLSDGSVLYDFVISGRPPVLPPGSGQGEHVTAFGLIKSGITRRLTQVRIHDREDLEGVRQLREQVNRYISQVFAIDPRVRSNFMGVLHQSQKSYNVQRTSKTSIKKSLEIVQTLEAMQDTLSVSPKDLQELRIMIEKGYVYNARLMCDEICEIARLFLTYYNQIPGAAFEQIESCKAPANQGNEVKEALEALNGIALHPGGTTIELERLIQKQKELDELPEEYSVDDGKTLEKLCDQHIKLNERLYLKRLIEEKEKVMMQVENERKRIPDMVGSNFIKLFFYPYVPDYAEQESESPTCRNNDPEWFYLYMAKHLHMAFSVYPELGEHQEEIVRNFVTSYIYQTRWKQVVKNIDVAIKSVKENITRILLDIIDITQEPKYDEDLSSSDSDIDRKDLGVTQGGSSSSSSSVVGDPVVSSVARRLDSMRITGK